MYTTNEIIQKEKIGKTTYIVKSFFAFKNPQEITDKLKKVIEEQIVKAPLKDDIEA